MTGVTNGYLEKISKKILGSEFLGVFPCDAHPKTRRKNFYVIFNLSKHNETGSHFVCISKKDNILTYFDALGTSLTNNYIKNFIKKLIKSPVVLLDLKTKIQADNSDFCGFFCLGFLISQKKNIPLIKFFNMFNLKNKEENDGIIKNFIISKIS